MNKYPSKNQNTHRKNQVGKVEKVCPQKKGSKKKSYQTGGSYGHILYQRWQSCPQVPFSNCTGYTLSHNLRTENSLIQELAKFFLKETKLLGLLKLPIISFLSVSNNVFICENWLLKAMPAHRVWHWCSFLQLCLGWEIILSDYKLDINFGLFKFIQYL